MFPLCLYNPIYILYMQSANTIRVDIALNATCICTFHEQTVITLQYRLAYVMNITQSSFGEVNSRSRKQNFPSTDT